MRSSRWGRPLACPVDARAGRGPVPLIWAIALVSCLAAGILYLFISVFAGGTVYPAWSTLRNDPAGASAIFESLTRLPGISVSQAFQPVEESNETGRTIFRLGLNPWTFARQSAPELFWLHRFAAKGNRLVLGLGMTEGGLRTPPRAPVERIWGIRLSRDSDAEGSPLSFAEARDWNVIERSGHKVKIVERGYGKGSIVLLADSRVLSNLSLAAAPSAETIAKIIGPNTRIVFDEAHFGIVESGSVVALARRYRLHGVLFGLAVCVALFIWKNASSFPPVAPGSGGSTDQNIVGRTSVAGLVTLLRRHIAPADLASVCWQEWLKTHARKVTARQRGQVEAILTSRAGQPCEALREIAEIVDRGTWENPAYDPRSIRKK